MTKKDWIFFVDDNEGEAMAVTEVIEQRYGDDYRVRGFTSPGDLLNFARKCKNKDQQVALVVTDMFMPVEIDDSGTVLHGDDLAAILHDEIDANLPVLGYSGHNNYRNPEEAEQFGLVGLLRKDSTHTDVLLNNIEIFLIEKKDKIETVKNQTKKMRSFAQSQQQIINSMILHEMGNFTAAIQAFIQMDYRIIDRMDKLLGESNLDQIKLREMIQRLAGRDEYDKMIADMKKYLETMENVTNKEFNLNELIKKSIEFHRNLFLRNNITIVKEFSQLDYQVTGDSSIIFNALLMNAVDAINQNRDIFKREFDAEIKISTIQTDTHYFAMFFDNGCEILDQSHNPMAKKEWDKIFDPLYSAKSSESGHKGLGLALAREFAEINGWELYVDESEESRYSKKFVIGIPKTTDLK